MRLKSEADPWGRTIPRTFADSRTRRLEAMLPRVVEAAAAIARAKVETCAYEQRRAAAQEAEAGARAEAERQRRIQERRTAAINQLLGEEAELRRLEQLLARLGTEAPARSRAERLVAALQQQAADLAHGLSSH